MGVESVPTASRRTVGQLQDTARGTRVSFQGRISTKRSVSKALIFVLLRDQADSVQTIFSNASSAAQDATRQVRKLPAESLIQAEGVLRDAPKPVRSASISDKEVAVESIRIISPARHVASWNTYKPVRTLRNRLASRVLDLRHPANQALFRIEACVMRTFAETLEAKGLVQVKTPKLQPAASESGAASFQVNYFGRKALLAQSPQLAKQMSICADFGGIFEIGPVFRAEDSNTHRHLTEYTGLDLEVAIGTGTERNHYHQAMDLVDDFLKRTFEAVYRMPEVDQARQRWPSERLRWLEKTPVVDFKHGVQLLREDGRDVEELADLSHADEFRLGQLVRERYGTDYYILDRFPAAARPFYTFRDPDSPEYTHSFDVFIRGREVCSGGQRIHDAQALRDSLASSGIPQDELAHYLEAFDLGAPPHAGAGLGLERIVAWLLELGDVRYASLYHRDPKSLPRRKPGLPHPEAATQGGAPHKRTRRSTGAELPSSPSQRQQHSPSPLPLAKLIANYGDSSNTSWLDDRFEVWNHPDTGAAVGYVCRGKLAIMTGDPLCDASQYKSTCAAFLRFITKERKLTPIWLLVSRQVQAVLAQDFRWRTFTCVQEQRVGEDRQGPNSTQKAGQKARRTKRAGVKTQEVDVRADAGFVNRVEALLEAWEAEHNKQQAHLTKVDLWADQEHRRYFTAEKDHEIQCLVVLARLAPRRGWQIKWALDFPGAVNGAIDSLLAHVLKAVSGPLTFGASPSYTLRPEANLNGILAKLLVAVYEATIRRMGLLSRNSFRDKFGTYGEDLFLCYPRHRTVRLAKNWKRLAKFFQE